MPLCRRCGRDIRERVDSVEALKTDGLQPKRRTLGASERDEFLRCAWRVLVAGGLDARRFVFVDECSTNTSLSPVYGWSRRGHRAHFRAPHNWGANVTLLSSMSFEGMGPSMAVEGSTTREVFEAYLGRVLSLRNCVQDRSW